MERLVSLTSAWLRRAALPQIRMAAQESRLDLGRSPVSDATRRRFLLTHGISVSQCRHDAPRQATARAEVATERDDRCVIAAWSIDRRDRLAQGTDQPSAVDDRDRDSRRFSLPAAHRATVRDDE
jgi:hypothetical protein